MKAHLPFRAALLAAALLLAGCEQLGIEDPAKVAASKEAEGKAIGAACRQSVRAIEDCYALNIKASKAAIFAGWREMDEYMRENKLEGVVPSSMRVEAALETEAKGAAKEVGKDATKSK